MSSGKSSIYLHDNLNLPKSFESEIYEFGRFRLDAGHLMLYRDSEPVALAPKIVETLVALVERRGDVVSKQELMERLWPEAFVEESNLTQNIYLLRKVLAEGSGGRELIETFRRRGYRFNGDVSTSDGNSAGTLASDENGASEVNGSRTYSSIAILPLTNLTDDPSAEYLSDGVTETVINRLTEISSLRVLARGTVFQYRDSKLSPPEIGRRLGVSAVAAGRILQHGERLIVRVELVSTADGRQIWGEQYDHTAPDLL